MSDPRPGFQRDVNAVVDAFKVGLHFDPPAISVDEYRDSLREVGMPLGPNEFEPPQFEFPETPESPDPPDDDPAVSPPEED